MVISVLLPLSILSSPLLLPSWYKRTIGQIIIISCNTSHCCSLTGQVIFQKKTNIISFNYLWMWSFQIYRKTVKNNMNKCWCPRFFSYGCETRCDDVGSSTDSLSACEMYEWKCNWIEKCKYVCRCSSSNHTQWNNWNENGCIPHFGITCLIEWSNNVEYYVGICVRGTSRGVFIWIF